MILIIPSFDFILNRGNDLSELFWPFLYYVKTHLIADHTLPFWNNLILAGTPLLPDPQTPLFYPLNLFALLMPLDAFFIFSFILHLLIGMATMYLCAKGGFKFSAKTSLFVALLYLPLARLAAYLEAGHVGLVYSLAWIPLALWASLKLRRTPKIKSALVFGIALALLYYSHLPTFLIIAFSFGFLALSKKSILHLLSAASITFSLTAVSLLPQTAWQKYSTRYLLLTNPDVYPKWTSVFEPIKNALIPWWGGTNLLRQINTEKWLAVGLITTALAFWGFLQLKKRIKFYFVSLGLVLSLIILNNTSPLYPLLLKQNWYLLLRVSTRFWILAILAMLYLVGLALEKMKPKLRTVIALLAILESASLGWLYLTKPVSRDSRLAPKEVYEFLASDRSLFRVFCLTRCLSQKEAAIYNLELLDGYNTIQQKNFYQQAWQLTGAYWNYYTLAIPPIGTYTFEKLKPDAKALGEYNVKYIIAPYALTDKNFGLIKQIDKFLIYENKLVKPRNYEIYTPNFIRIRLSDILHPRSIVIPEVYSPGWKAYLDGKEEVPVQETPIGLRAVDIKPETKFVDFRYGFFTPWGKSKR